MLLKSLFISSIALLVADCNVLRAETIDASDITDFGQNDGPYYEQLGHLIKVDTSKPAKDLNEIRPWLLICTRKDRCKEMVPIVFDPEMKTGYQFDLEEIRNSDFDPRRRTIVLIPGASNGNRPSWLQRVRDKWLDLEDVNVIIVTWKSANQEVSYDRLVQNGVIVSRIVSIFLRYLAKLFLPEHNIEMSEFLTSIQIVGHSLAGHMVGYIGKDFKGKIGRIISLDPACLIHDKLPRNQRLDKTDAQLVEVISTNVGNFRQYSPSGVVYMLDVSLSPRDAKFSKFVKSHISKSAAVQLGIEDQVAHVHYYANDGISQPGCPSIDCDHGRPKYLYEDILDYHLRARDLGLESDKLRPIAFPADSYYQFTSGSAFKNCGRLLNESSPVETYHAENCYIPLDPVKPVHEMKRELEENFGVDLVSKDYPLVKQNYFFFTLDHQRYISEHFLLRITLNRDHAVQWNSKCSLVVNLVMSDLRVVTLDLKRKVSFIETDDFHGLAIPFLNPDGFESLERLTELSKGNLEPDRVKELMPTTIELEVSYDKNSLSSSLKKSRECKKCELHIEAIEIRPLRPNFIEKIPVASYSADTTKKSCKSFSYKLAVARLEQS